MRRAAIAAIAALALAAGGAGCGSSPEDQARSDGKDVGKALYQLQAASTPQQARQAVGTIGQAVGSVRSKLPQGIAGQLQSIGDELRTSLRSAPDRAARQQAFLAARAQLDDLQSNTDSVVNEFRRGVREGYDNASG